MRYAVSLRAAPRRRAGRHAGRDRASWSGIAPARGADDLPPHAARAPSRAARRLRARRRGAGLLASAPADQRHRLSAATISGWSRSTCATAACAGESCSRGRTWWSPRRKWTDMSMKIYTRTGDRATPGSSAADGCRRTIRGSPPTATWTSSTRRSASRAPPRRSQLFDELLEAVQRDLFAIGGQLATPDPEKVAKALEKAELSAERVRSVRAGDGRRPTQELPPLRAFVLPGRHAQGRRAAPGAHRLPPRRAERRAPRARGRRCPRCSSSTSIGSPTSSSPSPAWPTTAPASGDVTW